MKALFIFMVTMVLLSSFTAPSHAILIDNLDGTITDSDTGLMWLQDANHAMGRFDFDGADDGLMRFFSFSDFISQMNAGNISGGNFGYTDWRLPTTLQPDPSCSGQLDGSSFGFTCTGSEMGHLFYTALGNGAGGPLTNTGPFLNLQSGFYWSSTQTDLLNPGLRWGFDFADGFQEQGNTFGYGLLVRGAGAAVLPEPATWLLLGTGLATLAALRRKRRSVLGQGR